MKKTTRYTTIHPWGAYLVEDHASLSAEPWVRWNMPGPVPAAVAALALAAGLVMWNLGTTTVETTTLAEVASAE